MDIAAVLRSVYKFRLLRFVASANTDLKNGKPVFHEL